MREYRFLLLNRELKAVRFLEFSCLDDQAAMMLAGAVGARHSVEVWHGARFVGGVHTAHAEDPDFGTPIDDVASSAEAAARTSERRLDA
jgi:hypothetical protein